ncbi:hypothetical protein LO762_17065 [Actinocorallia sp. API 0066]|uniref:DUF6879 family protein n=1 Tax=Actinocorallia sp. API 0066 TaxID=2896846 RepID=UPI001E48F1B3|nr:DUF6879 family protein [Actinocorallia sp. API 0066]MCD0450892.1 hypothetical protein [Actinocorallia sp. API 0066]
MSEVSFEDLLDGAEHEAVKFELRDAYLTSDPAYLGWLAGEPVEKVSAEYEDWTSLVRATVSRGVRIRRVRVVSEPVSEYVRFEHAVTPAVNLAGGEEIRWLARREARDLLIPAVDVWAVDGKTALFLHFSGEGDLVGSDVVTDKATVAPVVTAFSAAWKRAIPHGEFKV